MSKKGQQIPIPLFVQDWLGSSRIALLNAAEERGYFRLLMHQWSDQTCTLPSEDDKLAKLSLLRGAWKKSRENVLQFFQPHPQHAGRIHNEKLTEKWTERLEYAQSTSERGHKGAIARWSKPDNQYASSIAQALLEQSPSNSKPMASLFPLPSSLSEEKKDKTKTSEVLVADAPASEGKKAEEEPRDPPTQIDYSRVEAMLGTVPKRVQSSILDFIGFVANGLTTQDGVEGTARRLANLFESLKVEPIPHERYFCYGIEETMKRGAKSVEYVSKVIRNRIVKGLDGDR